MSHKKELLRSLWVDYHDNETLSYTVDPDHCNLGSNSLTRARFIGDL